MSTGYDTDYFLVVFQCSKYPKITKLVTQEINFDERMLSMEVKTTGT